VTYVGFQQSPSTPADTVGLFWAALQDEDPSLILLPKHIFRMRMRVEHHDVVPFGKAAIRREGRDVTVVSWGKLPSNWQTKQPCCWPAKAFL